MKGYEAKDLEQLFGSVGRIRKGKSEFSNDNTYWEGGHCNWGANHVLREDCETLARGFGKIETLGDIKDSLKKCTDETEFNYKKQDYLTTINEAISNLRPNIGSHSSMFGICIIWAHEAMNKYVQQKIDGCKREIEKVKNSLEKETYKWVQELNRIELEIKEIETRMEENKRKAMDPNISPSEKVALLEEIEADGKLLKQKYEEHQKHSNKFNFNAFKYVSDMVEGMKRAIEKSAKGSSGNGNGGDSGGGGRKKNKNGSGGDGGSGSGGLPDDGSDPNRPPRPRKEKDQKDNSQTIMIAVVVIVILFMLMNQKDSSSHRKDYDEEFYY